jgi:hypothetical protein
MHFEILVEDASGAKMLQAIVPKIIDAGRHTFRLRGYCGIGSIPKNKGSAGDARSQMLLNDLPRVLRGYGTTHASDWAPNWTAGTERARAAVLVVCDLGDRDENAFRAQLEGMLGAIDKKPDAHFCLAIEEGEAWLLGDRQAVLAAYPKANAGALKKYRQDFVCGTWEKLADAVYPGGHEALKRKGRWAVGAEKCRWAEDIAPLVEVGRNRSPSFGRFVKCLADLAGLASGQGA